MLELCQKMLNGQYPIKWNTSAMVPIYNKIGYDELQIT